jgi:hypothetical protein
MDPLLEPPLPVLSEPVDVVLSLAGSSSPQAAARAVAHISAAVLVRLWGRRMKVPIPLCSGACRFGCAFVNGSRTAMNG